MRRSLTFFALLILTGVGAFTQTRESIRIFVQSAADDLAQLVFFRDSFMEEIGAEGYSVASRSAADYILNLTVRPNLILSAYGTLEPAPPNEKQFNLQVSLIRSLDNAEIVAFSFPFTSTAEVNTRYLFYQVMTNLPYFVQEYTPPAPPPAAAAAPQSQPDGFVGPERIIREVPGPERIVEVPVPGPERIVEVPVPGPERIVEVPVPVEIEVVREVQVPTDVVREVEVIKEVQVPVEVITTKEIVIEVQEPDFWRNKWLYFRVSADVPFSVFENRSGQSGKVPIIVPGATLGLELQFLNWMSVEADFIVRFADVIDYSFIPGAELQLKFPIKPARYFMLEPYLAAAFSVNIEPHSDTPYLDAGGGFQFGVRGGQLGALFLDMNFMYTINIVRTKTPDVINWNRFVVGLGIGYKFGFANRGK